MEKISAHTALLAIQRECADSVLGVTFDGTALTAEWNEVLRECSGAHCMDIRTQIVSGDFDPTIFEGCSLGIIEIRVEELGAPFIVCLSRAAEITAIRWRGRTPDCMIVARLLAPGNVTRLELESVAIDQQCAEAILSSSALEIVSLQNCTISAEALQQLKSVKEVFIDQ